VLEDEQTSAEARQPIVDRIAELRRTLAEREAALAKLRDETPPPPPDPQAVAELLATLPLLDSELRGLSKPRLRELLQSLNLTISYDHNAHRGLLRCANSRCAEAPACLRYQIARASSSNAIASRKYAGVSAASS
jgi:hypothetical protein